MELAAWIALGFAALRLATPLAIAATGELLAERAGVLNIGVEGMMLAGAFTAFATADATGSAALGAVGGSAAGAVLASLFGLFALRRQADPIVTGAALNILALGATGTAYRLLFPADRVVPDAPTLTPDLPVNLFYVLALLLVVGVGLFLSRTRPGLAVRAAGERAEAAHAQGLRVLRIRWACTLFGGACAGLAGSSLVLWISSTFVEGMTAGRGFIALALVLFGGYRPARIVAGAILFGAASALQFRLQALGLDIPYALLLMLPYVLTLLVLALFARSTRPPSGLAAPFSAG